MNVKGIVTGLRKQLVGFERQILALEKFGNAGGGTTATKTKGTRRANKTSSRRIANKQAAGAKGVKRGGRRTAKKDVAAE